MKKRILAALVLAAMAASAMASCNNNNGGSSAGGSTPASQGSSQSGGPSAGSTLSPVGEYPLSSETQPLSILMAPYYTVEDYDTNALTLLAEEALNVEFEFVFLPSTDPDDKLAIMISSGEELPDVVNHSMNMATCYRYAQAGAFLPLNDYYETSSVYAKKNADDHPEFGIMEAITSPDGNIYTLYGFTKNNHDEMMYKLWINRTWLKDLELEMPTTTAEFEAVLEAFKTRDPNSNGVADEIPLAGATGWSEDPTINLMNAFVFETGKTDRLIIGPDGKLSTTYLQPNYKEGLKYMHGLVEKGLLDPVTFTQDDSQLRAMVDDQEIAKVGVFAFSSITLLDVNTSKWIDDYAPMPPLTGPDGTRNSSVTLITAAPQWHVTKNARNPELAFRVGDWFANPELWNTERYGVEGTDWEKNPEDPTGLVVNEIHNIWATDQNSHWHTSHPKYYYDEMTTFIPGYEEDHWRNRIRTAIAEYAKARPDDSEIIGNLVYTDEELDQISEISSTLSTYVKECKTRFITGDMDIDGEWDAFQKELQNIGVEKLLEVSQNAWDRMHQ
ncbi:MAG: extracellular solute-binding protein [Oscillospiraceae bacterium]|jgi:putative aldouronate transport system substrate-binding protein|nr:extracellular solute-binding protein [Oscillospiraceae bacterium]